jgi:hypothetical protein
MLRFQQSLFACLVIKGVRKPVRWSPALDFSVVEKPISSQQNRIGFMFMIATAVCGIELFAKKLAHDIRRILRPMVAGGPPFQPATPQLQRIQHPVSDPSGTHQAKNVNSSGYQR